LVLAQGLGLLLQGGGQGPLSQAGGGDAGDLLHRVKIDIEARAGGAEGAAGDDFAPASGQVTDLLQEFSGEIASRHGVPCLGVANPGWLEVLQAL
jgi:hypothetical protein